MAIGPITAMSNAAKRLAAWLVRLIGWLWFWAIAGLLASTALLFVASEAWAAARLAIITTWAALGLLTLVSFPPVRSRLVRAASGLRRPRRTFAVVSALLLAVGLGAGLTAIILVGSTLPDQPVTATASSAAPSEVVAEAASQQGDELTPTQRRKMQEMQRVNRGVDARDPDFDVGRYCLDQERAGRVTFEECLAIAASKVWVERSDGR